MYKYAYICAHAHVHVYGYIYAHVHPLVYTFIATIIPKLLGQWRAPCAQLKVSSNGLSPSHLTISHLIGVPDGGALIPLYCLF
jgi:hypothetical protein